MGDFGLRVSEKGKDVRDDTDLEMTFNSKYPLLKEGVSGTGSINIDDTYRTSTIYHGLGYAPMAIVSVNDGFGSDNFCNLPVWVQPVFDPPHYLYCYTDTTNLYITGRGVGFGTTLTFLYKYIIFKDKGLI